jgi:tetratricopeptide (TPR) repeat protein
MMASTPAWSVAVPSAEDVRLAYVEARAAAMTGDHSRSAALLASLAQSQPQDVDLARKALAEAIGSGQIELGLKLARTIPTVKLSSEARLLLATDEIRRRQLGKAIEWLSLKGDNGDLAFLVPLVNAWEAAERNDANRALQAVDAIPANSLLTPLKAEERALILLKFRRAADAEPYARQALGTAGNREIRLRLAFADGFLASGDRTRAAAMVEGISADAWTARQNILAGRPSGESIDTLSRAMSETIVAFASDLIRLQRSAPPIGLVQVARYADPENGNASLILALLLDGQDRSDEALAVLNTIPRDDALIAQARDATVRILSDQKRFNEAYAIAAPAASASDAGPDDYSRLGDLLAAMKRNKEAADAYGRAIALGNAQGVKADLWSLLLLRASALDQSGQWPEAKKALEQGLAIAPDQPLLLNYLGYGKLERGEEMDSAEAMIRKASQLAPDDASITDSLGWAQYKRGKVAEAISTLQVAAEKDPDQAEIQEHLGDALFKAGRRFEARFAWEAALVTAEDDIATRVKAKLVSGLTTANSAP